MKEQASPGVPPTQAAAVGGGVVLLVLGLQQFIMAYDTTAMNVAISQIVADLNTTLTGVQSAITLYALVMAAFMMVGAALGDVFGRKRIFAIGALIYGTGALVTAFSQNLGMLIFGWSLLEGIGAALVMPAILTLTILNFDAGEARTKAFSAIGALGAVGATLGPIIAGFLTTFLSWRVSFALEVVVVLVVVGLHGRLQDSDRREPLQGFDFAGAALSALGFSLIVFGLLLASSYGFFSARQDVVIGGTVVIPEGGISPTPILVALGVVVVALFIAWESRRLRQGQEPLVRPALLKFRAIRIGVIEMAFLFLVQAGVMFVIPVYTQISLEYDALQSGLAMVPLSVAVIIAAVFISRRGGRYLPRGVIRVGFALLAVGSFLAAAIIIPNRFDLGLAPGLILLGLGIGLIMALVQNLVLAAAQRDNQGEVAGLARSLSYLGSSFGTALAGAVLIGVMLSTATTLTTQSAVLNEQEQTQVLAALEGDVQAVSDTQMVAATADAPPEIQAEVVSINATARDAGLRAALVMLGIFSLLAFALSFRLPGPGMSPDPAPDVDDGLATA